MDEVRVRQVGLVNLCEVDAHEEWLARLRHLVEVFEGRLLDVFVEERDADHALLGRVDVLAVDLEILGGFPARLPRQHANRHLVEHRAQFFRHRGKPGGVAISVGVEVVEKNVPHLVVTLGDWHSVVGLAEMPLPREEGLVPRRFSRLTQGSTLRQVSRRLVPGTRRWSCRCDSGCDQFGQPHGPACSLAAHRRKKTSCPPPTACRGWAWACRVRCRRRKRLHRHSQSHRTG